MSTAPDVDYSATSLRPAWSSLPLAIREAVAEALGAEVAEAGSPVSSGFTGGFAAPLQLADGRRVFMKASADTLHSYRAYQREAEVVPQLPAAIKVPTIIATAHAVDDGGSGGSAAPASSSALSAGGGRRWFAVLSEWVPGRMPGRPWTREDFERVSRTCEQIAQVMEPSPLGGLKSFLSDLNDTDAPLQTPARILAGEAPLPTGLQPWVPKILPELVALVELAPEAFAGDTATHGDLRPDNLLIDGDGTCWTVDWNWLALGPRWMDWLGLLPVAQHHGIDTAAAIRTSPLAAGVPADHLDCYIAAVAAYMMRNADAPPPFGCTPALREHQRYYAWTFLEWLAVRRGWLP
ncbi:phosphotransferase family enzyme [Kribbella antiqua]|uniref:Phosphotransferase family enzyme n=1 Tax=Kribbella antiqua TaxID=2512217 RepID=A0A4V2S5C0_9ACTN|nr:phosphotransferase [Kribbella antiqua]TCO51570.1 phosphotransferase family enzyme [Kribbella antiqua]